MQCFLSCVLPPTSCQGMIRIGNFQKHSAFQRALSDAGDLPVGSSRAAQPTVATRLRSYEPGSPCSCPFSSCQMYRHLTPAMLFSPLFQQYRIHTSRRCIPAAVSGMLLPLFWTDDWKLQGTLCRVRGAESLNVARELTDIYAFTRSSPIRSRMLLSFSVCW